MFTNRKYPIQRKHKLSADRHTAETIYVIHQLGSSAYISCPCTKSTHGWHATMKASKQIPRPMLTYINNNMIHTADIQHALQLNKSPANRTDIVRQLTLTVRANSNRNHMLTLECTHIYYLREVDPYSPNSG